MNKAVALLLTAAVGPRPFLGVWGQDIAALMSFVPPNCTDLIGGAAACFTANPTCLTDCDIFTYQPPGGDDPCSVGGCVLSHFTSCCDACGTWFGDIAACSKSELGCDLNACDADGDANATDPGTNGTDSGEGSIPGLPALPSIPECGDKVRAVTSCVSDNLRACGSCLLGLDVGGGGGGGGGEGEGGGVCGAAGALVCAVRGCCEGCADVTSELGDCVGVNVMADEEPDDTGSSAAAAGGGMCEIDCDSGILPGVPLLPDVPECGDELEVVRSCLIANLLECQSCLMGLDLGGGGGDGDGGDGGGGSVSQMDACGASEALVCAVEGCCEGCATETADFGDCVGINVMAEDPEVAVSGGMCEIDCDSAETETSPTADASTTTTDAVVTVAPPTETETTAAGATAPAETTTTTATLPAGATAATTTTTAPPDVTPPSLPQEFGQCLAEWTAMTGCVTENIDDCASCLASLTGIADAACDTLRDILCGCCSVCLAQTAAFKDCIIENGAENLPGGGGGCDLTCPGDGNGGGRWCSSGVTAAVAAVGAGLAWVVA